MFGRKNRQTPQQQRKPKAAQPDPRASRVKASILSLESRLMFDAAAAATASEVNQEQVAQEQAEAAVSSEGNGGEPTAAETESQELLQAITSYNPGESTTEIVFVDPTVPNYQELLSGMDLNIEVIMLDGSRDGIEQIAEALAGRNNIDAIHLISHGDAGMLQLGTGTLNTETMSGQYADELAIIQQALSEQADILVYGCDFAKGETGQAAATRLAELTGADIAASTDDTGQADLGGDWDLEFETGLIQTHIVIVPTIQENWNGLLDISLLNATQDTYIKLKSPDNVNNFGDSTSLMVDRESTDLQRALLQFDLSSIPAGSTINSATLKLQSTQIGGTLNISVYEVTESWSEGSGTGTAGAANWNERAAGTNWTTAGGTYDPTAVANLNTNATGQHTWNITSLVQAWFSGTKTNNGLMVASPDGGGNRTVTYDSSEGATVPVLEINYTPPPNVAPTITSLSGDSLAYAEGDGAVVIEQGGNALVADVDSSNLDTGTLTVSIPSGGDSAEDVLSIRNQGTGAGQIGVSGSNVTYQGVTIGTFTGGSSGSNLVITLNSSATPTAVTALVKNITYQNTDTNAPTTGARTVRYVLTDGDGGTSANYDTTVTVSGVNDAPVLDSSGTMTLTTITEDQTTNSGNTVASIIASAGGDRITDVDTGAVEGIAITALNSGNGTWQYSTNGGGTWANIGSVTNTSALLLRSTDLVRFVPDGQNATSADFTFRAWDQTSGTVGTKIDVSTNGGTTVFSSTTETASITVTAVNDAPYMPGVALGSTNEDATKTWQVSTFAGYSSDADTGALKGLAIVGVDNTNGTWQYTLDSTNWVDIDSGASASNALLLAADATSAFRFVPNANWNGTTGMLQYKAWDQTSGTAGTYVDTSTSGGTTAFSGTSGSVLTVNAVNDAPTALSTSVSLGSVAEDTSNPAGATVSSLFGSTFSDVKDQVTDGSSSNSFAGIAITANTANASTEGTWQWYNDTSWVDVSTSVSTSSALVLSSTTLVRFLPNADYNGSPGTLTARLIDDSSGAVTSGSTVNVTTSGGTTRYSDASNAVTLSTSITSVNDAPVADDDSYSLNEDSSLVVPADGVLLNDADIDGNPITAVLVTGPTHATSFTLNPDGSFTYTPEADWSGTDTFTYKANDGTSDGNVATVTITVNPVNDAPTITYLSGDTLAYNEGDGAVVIEQGANAIVADVDSANFDTGTLTVSFSAGSDSAEDVLGILNQGTGAGQIGVSGGNVTYGGVTIGTFTGGSGGSNLVITFNSSATPTAVTALVKNITYSNTDTAAPTTGARTVRFVLTDGDGGTSANYDTTVTVSAVNDPPVNTVPGAQTVAEDTPLSLSGVSVNDVDGNLSTVELGVVNGTVSVTLQGGATISAGNNASNTLTLSGSEADINATLATLVYQGSLNYNGADTLTVTSTDANSGTDVDTVAITVTAVNDATLITGGTSGSGAEDTVLTGTLTATDAEGLSDGTVFTVSTNATNGTASIDPATGLWSYSPNADWNGSDSFTVTITDDAGNTATQVISVTVTPVVDLTDDSLTTAEDTAISANVLTGTNGATADSFEGTPVLTGVTQGAHGSVTFLADGTVTYTPNANFTGPDSFTYSITSGGVTETATVNVTVTAVNDAPTVAVNTGSTVAEGGTDTISSSELAVTDVEQVAAQLTYSIGTGPAYGRLELTTAPGVAVTSFTQADIDLNRLVYVHDGSETTSDNFTFTVSDGAGGSLGATTMTLTITPVNDAPTIISNGGGPTTSINVVENVSAVTIVTGADVDLPAQTLTYSISGGVDQARFTINAATGALNFTAPPDFEVATDANGDNVYVVQVEVIDSQGASTTQTIQVTVTDVAEALPHSPTTPAIPPVLLPTTPTPPTSADPTPSSLSSPSEPPADPPPPASVVPSPRATPSDFQPVNVDPPSTDSLAERIIALSDELKKLVEIARDQAGFIPHDDTRRPVFTVLPVEPVPVLDPDPVPKQQSTSDLLLAKLSEMAGSLEQAIGASEEHHELVTRVAALTGTTLSIGFIVWALRSGALLASFMATMPAWRHFDPLPVLGGTRSEWERRRKDNERDQQAEAAEYRGLKKLLG